MGALAFSSLDRAQSDGDFAAGQRRDACSPWAPDFAAGLRVDTAAARPCGRFATGLCADHAAPTPRGTFATGACADERRWLTIVDR
jgi:hypothetical protein